MRKITALFVAILCFIVTDARGAKPDSVFQYTGPDYTERLSFSWDGEKYEIKYKGGSRKISCECNVYYHGNRLSTDSIAMFEDSYYTNVYHRKTYHSSLYYDKMPSDSRTILVFPSIPFTLVGKTAEGNVEYANQKDKIVVPQEVEEFYVTFPSRKNKKHVIKSDVIKIPSEHNVVSVVLNEKIVFDKKTYRVTNDGLVLLDDAGNDTNHVLKRIRPR